MWSFISIDRLKEILDMAMSVLSKVSPSILGKYFLLDCERMLRYSTTPEELREEQGVPAIESAINPVIEAIAASGRCWEEKVVREKLGDKVIMGAGEGIPLCERVLPYKDVLTALENSPKDTYLYQAHLKPPSLFYRRYGIDKSQIVFSPCRPDLIFLHNGNGKKTNLSLLDIKASNAVKFSHCVQTVLYALILRDVLAEHRIKKCRTDMDRCYIWLFNRESPEEFAMENVIEAIETFLREKLPRILLQPAALAPWSLSHRCEWCEYFEHCWKEAEEKRDLSLLPYLPPEAKKFLSAQNPPILSLDQLRDCLDQDAARMFRTCGALVGRSERLRAEVEAMLSRKKNKKGKLRGGKPIVYRDSSVLLPKGQHVGIVFTLQQDPMTGAIFAAGFHVHGGKEIHAHKAPWTAVAKRLDQDSCQQVVEEFFDRLEQVMRAVDEYNLEHENWGEQKSLQCYVYDGYERDLLYDLLGDALQNPTLAYKALSMFFYFQGKRPTQIKGGTNNEIPMPVIVLTDVIRASVGLPIPITYRLPATSIVLKPDKYVSVYRETAELTFPLSNKLRTGALTKAHASGDSKELEEVREAMQKDLEKRLKATFSVIAGLRQCLKDMLFSYPPKFFLPRFELSHPILARLAFITRYEEVVQYLEIQAMRSLPHTRLLESGKAMRIQLVRENDGVWEATLASQSAHVMPDASGYQDWLMCCDDKDSSRDQMSFSDFQRREQRWLPRKSRICFVAIEESFQSGEMRCLRLRISPSASFPALCSGTHYLLFRRYSDFTSKYVLSTLENLDHEPGNPFLSLIENPRAFLERRRRPKKVRRKDDLQSFLKKFGFTTSQGKAFRKILDNSHQLIWGPPGTGKTHFLGLLTLSLIALYESEGKPLKVLLTAFTHAAIENCLQMIVRLEAQFGPSPLDIVKLGKWKGENRPRRIASKKVWLEKNQYCIAGATIYSIARENCIPGNVNFDLVIIDESSQLKVSEAAIPISRVNPKSGRLVISGDNCQLGPILKGKYIEPEKDTPPLFGSIFRYLRHFDLEHNSYTSQLHECFRMNDTLCRFPAQKIYGDKFYPVDEKVEQRRIHLAAEANDKLISKEKKKQSQAMLSSKVQILETTRRAWILDPTEANPTESWLNWALDPDYPLVLLVLDGVSALVENPTEAGIAADLTMAFRERLLEKRRPYKSDRDFWQKGLFVVSPHHIQINAITQELNRRRDWKYPPFVDTVDKMQGQESECVIISYGVADIDYALKEGEFIYSLNRLNVAITRARSKAIVCLPAPLLIPPLSAFAHSEFIEGLDFMLGLRSFVEKTGEQQQFPLSHAGEQTRLLAYRTR